MTEAQYVYQLKIQKVRVKTNFTNERRALLMLLDNEWSSEVFLFCRLGVVVVLVCP